MAEPGREAELQEATNLHVAGRLAEAGASYRRILEACPEHPVALHRLGVLTLQEGRPGPARELFERAVALDPAAWRSHCALGQCLAALGLPLEAAAAFQRALAHNPECFEALMGLGQVRAGEEALAAFRQALVLRPESAQALACCGNVLLAQGRPGEAVADYKRALTCDPAHLEARNNLGIALQQLGRPAEAAAAFRRVLAFQADDPLTHANLGNALLLNGQPAEARKVLEAAAARWPEVPDLHYNLGIAAFALFDFPGAAQAFRATIALAPGHLAARNNLGNALQAMGRYLEALEVYRQAIAVGPRFVDTYNNASAAARTLGLLDEAMAHLGSALALDPAFQVGHGNLGNVLKDMGRIPEAMASYRRALALDPGDAVTHSNLVYTACFHPGYEPGDILRETRGWDEVFGAPLGREIRPHTNPRDPDRPLRVGYVSPNFKEHVLAHFLVPLLSHHDRERFRTFGYSLAPRPDAFTLRFRGLTDGWRDVADLDDARLAAQIREDGIDILVDLTMHMSNGRPLLFARKPAPVQVAWLAYPGTTGLAAMDYRLTDPNLDPEGRDGDYAERSIRLPEIFSCYDPLAQGPPPGPPPALANGFVTFGSFNNFSKMNPAVADLWCRVLAAVPGSRLLLLAPQGDHRRLLLERMAEGDIEPGRISFASFQPRADYLALHQRVDIALDTFPYSGHTTSLDALWMGVPVVTQVGRTVVGRTCWTLLCNLGLQELAAMTGDGYVAIATALARDLPRLAALRAGLRGRMEASPLMDAPRFARNIEQAYRAMWVDGCR